MRRLRSLLLALPPLATALALGCTDARPCTDCPPIAGAWAVSWKNGIAQDKCPTQGPRPVSLNITQAGNTAASIIGGVDVKGVVYDTWDFSLTGTGPAASYTLHARAAPGATADAGLHMEGSLQTSGTPDGGTACDLTEEFSGDHL